MEELENDPENPCFGCGPNNPKGLRLKFFRDGTRVVAETTLGKEYSAWPGQAHGGVAFAALECTCQWTFYTHVGQVGPTERFSMDFKSRILVGKPLRLVGRVKRETPRIVSVRAELIQGRTVRAFMEQDIRVVKDRKEFARLRPSVEITDVMAKNLPP